MAVGIGMTPVFVSPKFGGVWGFQGARPPRFANITCASDKCTECNT
jgi:hypothetical protein